MKKTKKFFHFFESYLFFTTFAVLKKKGVVANTFFAGVAQLARAADL